jgi:hypothetical protein
VKRRANTTSSQDEIESARNATKMILVVGRDGETMDESGCANPDVAISDESPAGSEVGIDLCGLDDDLVGQRQDSLA